MAKTLSNLIVHILSGSEERRFTARQIANSIFSAEPEWCQAKKEKSTAINSDVELLQQLVAEIGAQRPSIQKRYPQIKTTAERPKKYYWSNKTDEEEVEEPTDEDVTTEKVKDKLQEADLYPILASYLHTELGVYCKRIDERRSSNNLKSGSNQWLYPDLVGMEDLFSEWNADVRQLVDVTSQPKARLWSFEVKIKVNRANLRQVYFQAVSNSTWANFGYLVAAELSGDDTMTELRMLHGLHGIGVVQIDPENPTESQIIIPARERSDVDWATCSRIAKENRDFRDYLTLVKQFYQTGDPRKEGWS